MVADGLFRDKVVDVCRDDRELLQVGVDLRYVRRLSHDQRSVDAIPFRSFNGLVVTNCNSMDRYCSEEILFIELAGRGPQVIKGQAKVNAPLDE